MPEISRCAFPRIAFAIASVAFLMLAAIPAQSQTINPSQKPEQPPAISNLQGIGPAIRACWKPPAGSEGMAATVRFSFRRDGTLMGVPRITHTQQSGDSWTSRAFMESIAAAFIDCTPLPFSPSMGQAVAGRIFTMRFIPGARRL